jgi:hypothetical protein
MPICFVSLITLYKEGFEKIDDLPEEIQQEFYKVRESEISHMLELQFYLIYLGNISKAILINDLV